MTADEMRERLREELFDGYRAEYVALLDGWKVLEAKAQASVAISGIFLAATFAYAREGVALTLAIRTLVLMSTLLLIGCVISALLSLRLRAIAIPPLGTFLRQGVRDVSRQADAQVLELAARFDVEIIQAWEEAIRTIALSNRRKAQMVTTAKVCVAAAVITFGGAVLLRLAGVGA